MNIMILQMLKSGWYTEAAVLPPVRVRRQSVIPPSLYVEGPQVKAQALIVDEKIVPNCRLDFSWRSEMKANKK